MESVGRGVRVQRIALWLLFRVQGLTAQDQLAGPARDRRDNDAGGGAGLCSC
jgi:hypothetical protein